MIGNRQKDENSNTGLHNALAGGTIVKGDIVTETDFRLDGNVEGNITCKGKIVIGVKGIVVGNIEALSAEISGKIVGSVVIKGTLILKSTAIIDGDIESENLEIEPKAMFNGACKMTNAVESSI